MPKLKSLRKYFAKSSRVFGIPVFGTYDVDSSKFDHAVNVLRGYLDNDGDGKADSKKLVKSLKRKKVAMTIFLDEREIYEFPGKYWKSVKKIGVILKELFDDEIVTNADESGRFDTSLEEALHLIFDYGNSKIYPK